MSNHSDIPKLIADKYEVRRLIHDGPFIQIFQAYQTNLNRSVALQTLSPRSRTVLDYHQGIIQAAKITAGFVHPNIAPSIDLVEHEGVPYIVIQFMEGGSLRDRLKQGFLGVREIAGVVKQIGNALDYIHAQGKVHGDPSTASISFDLWGSAYISDFIKCGFDEIGSRAILGMPPYVAPERWRGQKSTSFSDQYALGAISYEMIAGHPPFQATTIEGMMSMHIHEPVPQIKELPPNVPSSVNSVLATALAKEPGQRYPTVMTFAREFEKTLADQAMHLFVSYSHQDKSYVGYLKDDLTKNGFQVWIDETIKRGSRWFKEIDKAIQGSVAVLVIMTPEAQESEWVQKEILLAMRYNKPVFPLLLKGQEFPLLIDIQFVDVRNGAMPGETFYRELSRKVYGTGQ